MSARDRGRSLQLVLAFMAMAVPALAQQAGGRSVTQGRAQTVVENLFRCANPDARNQRIAGVGRITATDGTVWTVPADVEFGKQAPAFDLYNECARRTPADARAVDGNDAPIVTIDADGEVVTGYIMSDNYFEFWVNGKLVAIDAIPFTPFNSAIVKFRVKKPATYVFKLVDWEEHLGLGMEKMGDRDYHAGDGGLIARFSDGVVTDSSWKAQTFYIAPLAKPEDVIEKDGRHDTSHLGRIHPHAKIPDCRDRCFGVHYKTPDDWAKAGFDDTQWPRAFEYTDDDVGVNGMTGYTRYPELFAGARWIWSSNLVFDNLVIARKTAP